VGPFAAGQALSGSPTLEVGFAFEACVLLRGAWKGRSQSRKHACPFVLQFLTFSERLSNVNINIIHRIDRTGSYAEVRTAIAVIC